MKQAFDLYETLKKVILEKYPAARLVQHNILLGVGGTIFKEFDTTMHALGVESVQNRKEIAKKLVIIAAQGIERAINYRHAWLQSGNHRKDGPAFDEIALGHEGPRRHAPWRHKPP